jgi:hypothetical protein
MILRHPAPPMNFDLCVPSPTEILLNTSFRTKNDCAAQSVFIVDTVGNAPKRRSL